jgi:predicted glycoside hydrolase/deacetylase ChbG (UPF0249 family)
MAMASLMEMGAAATPAAAHEMVNVLQSQFDSSGVGMPDAFIFDFYAEKTTLGDLLNLLLSLPDGVSELMCHPGEVDDVLRETSSYTDYRAAEVAALTHPSVRELLVSEQIDLVSFGALR